MCLVALVAAASARFPWERLLASPPAGSFVAPSGLLRPEPVESATFALAAAVACLLPWGLSLLVGAAGPARRGWVLASGAAALLLVVGTALARPGVFDAGGLGLAPVVPYAVVALVVWFVLGPSGPSVAEALRPFGRRGRGAALFGAVFVVVLSFLGALLDERALSSQGWPHPHHLASLMGPLTEAASGKTVYVDLDATYGAYAQLLAPLAALVGPRLLLLSGLFALLRVASLLPLWAALRRMVRRRGLADLAFVGIGAWHVLGRVSAAASFDDAVFDPYLQYRPLRTLFPALALWLLARWVQQRRPSDRALLLALCPAAVLWNADSGMAVVIFVAAGLALSSPKASFRALVGWGALAMTAVAAGTFAYSCFALARTGTFPPPWASFATGGSYVRSGLMLLPLPSWHPWLAVAAAYAAVLGAVAQRRARGRLGPTGAFLGATAVLGVGLFVYYQGRSHDANLPSVIVPVLVIGAVLLDRLLDERLAGGDVAGHLKPALVLLLAVPLLGALGILQGAGALAAASVRGVLGSEPPGFVDVGRQAAFLGEKAKAGSRPLVLSHFAWILHFRTGTSTPLRRAALAEFVELRELDELRRLLGPTGVDSVFVSADDPMRFFRPEVAGEFDGLLQSGFSPTESSSDGGLVLYRRRKADPNRP